MVIGVLALQGAFKEHIEVLNQLGVKSKEIRTKKDLENIVGIIIPGGESTAIGKLLIDLDIKNSLMDKIKCGLPVFGTCAGMILLAKKLVDDNKVHLGVMDIEVKRNAYGRQLESFKTFEKFAEIDKPIEMVFIRAPYIVKIGKNVEVLSELNNNIVAAREKNMLVTSFHPELTSDNKVHQYFLKMLTEYIDTSILG